MKHVSSSIRKLICAMLAIAMLVCSASSAFAVSKGDILRVKQDYVRIRKSPQSGSKVLGKLRKGTRVVYLGEKNGWMHLQLSSGKKGYIYKSMLKSASASTPKVGKIYRSNLKGKKLTVYSKANSSSKKLGAIKASTDMVLLGRKGLWGKVRILKNGKVGYVNVRHLKAK